mgnify:CR=1 FL=1
MHHILTCDMMAAIWESCPLKCKHDFDNFD